MHQQTQRQPKGGQRTRVLHLSQGLDMGGQEKLLVEFARHADRDRFDLRFVSLGAAGVLARDIRDLGWPVTALEQPSGLRPLLVLRLAQLFRHCRAEVVHTHNNRPLVYSALAARAAGVRRFIHTRHGQSFGASPRQIRLVGVAARWVDAFVCVSQDSARLSVEQKVPARLVRRIWNGIDTARFAALPARSEGPAVLVARLSPEKDIATLLRAAALVLQKDPSFRLDIAGEGPCRGDLERLAAELRLGERVRFLGQVHDVAPLLAGARQFVLSSISEGISLTLLEAMARGLPLVATAVGGNPEVVADGVTGILVPPRDPERMAQALSRLHGDFHLRREMGQMGRQRVEEHFDIRRMVARYEALYEEKSRRNGSRQPGDTPLISEVRG